MMHNNSGFLLALGSELVFLAENVPAEFKGTHTLPARVSFYLKIKRRSGVWLSSFTPSGDLPLTRVSDWAPKCLSKGLSAERSLPLAVQQHPSARKQGTSGQDTPLKLLQPSAESAVILCSGKHTKKP